MKSDVENWFKQMLKVGFVVLVMMFVAMVGFSMVKAFADSPGAISGEAASKEQVQANKYDLSASRYRQVEQDAVYYEKPAVTMERLLTLEQVTENEINELKGMLS